MEVKITNRSNGSLGYVIPDLGIRRNISAYETIEVEEDEIKKLRYQQGGQELLDMYIKINDKNLAQKYSPEVSQEPEYWYSKEEVIRLLTTGSLEELLDCLDFGMDGVIDMVKDIAVELPLTDTRKMNAIKAKTKFNVANAIANKEEEAPKVVNHQRRVQPAATTSGRRINK